MPIDIRRFGVGHRRKDGPPGTTGVTGQVIHSDARGVISELAFSRNGRVDPHSSPNTTWFIVIEGGGWVIVDGERARIASGEAVFWPPDVPHGAWADHSPMRAIVVELSGGDDADVQGLIAARAEAADPALESLPARGDGSLRGAGPAPLADPAAGEPH
jgi:quercetin dioxygenase-like cupin family protein